MKEGRSLQAVAKELQRQREAMRDFKAPTTKLRFITQAEAGIESKGNVLIDTGKSLFEMNDLFMGQVAGWTKIDKRYFDRCRAEAPRLLAQNVNHWFQNTKDPETRLIRTMDGTARAFLSHRYRIIDNIDVVETVLPIFATHGIATMSTEVTDNHLYIKGVNQRKTTELKVGEKVQFGVTISNSEVGLGAVHVDPLVYTLACKNGAVISSAGLRKFHIGRRLQELEDSQEVFKDDTVVADNKAFFLKLRDVVNAAFDETAMTDVLAAIEAGTQRKLGEGKFPEEVVEVTSKKYALASAESEGILRHLIEGRDLTQWGLAAAVTAYSQKLADYERATELEQLGGTIMTLDEKGWKELN